MPMNEDDRLRMKMHIAINKFKCEHHDGTIMDYEGGCDCGKWVVGELTCACGNKLVHLDYDEMTGIVFPTSR